RLIGTAPPTRFPSVRLLCAAAAARLPSRSATEPTLELASKRRKQPSRTARTNRPPNHRLDLTRFSERVVLTVQAALPLPPFLHATELERSPVRRRFPLPV